MKVASSIVTLLTSLALVPFAVDWRSPFLVDWRSWMLAVLIAVPIILILVQIQVLRKSRREQWLLRSLASLGLLAAVLALTATVVLEGRFHWGRYQVLHAEPGRLARLGRHLIVGYRNFAEAQELVRLRAVTGIFISSHNVRGKSIPEIRQEIQSLQSERQKQGLPRLWIATDQEGGVVSRLSPPLTHLPALSEIVERYSDVDQRKQAVQEFAATQGRELADLGVNLNFAPVADVNHQVVNPNDLYTRISQRAISSDPAVVAQVAAWYCATLGDKGVRCTLKHFPGLGRVFEDTHREHADLTTSLTELSSTDWQPFRALMNQSPAFTMLGHVRLTAIDKERPVSMSAPVISGLLRVEWKYDGVLITDNFSMLAVYRSSMGIDNGGVEALNAGVDLILISCDPDQYYRVMYALLKADLQGKLNAETLRRSNERLARAVRSRGTDANAFSKK